MKQECGDFFQDWPEYTTHTEEIINNLSPKNKEKAYKHIERMQAKRKLYEDKLDRINKMVSEGKCYCNDEYLCALHAEKFHALHSALIKDNLPLPEGGIQELIRQARNE